MWQHMNAVLVHCPKARPTLVALPVAVDKDKALWIFTRQKLQQPPFEALNVAAGTRL